MRAHRSFFVFFAAVALAFSLSLHASPASPPAAPCTKATTACEQWITYGNGPARSVVYSTFPLYKRNPQVTRALIMIHGALRNADHYFRTATAAGFLADALGNTIIIAPHFIDSRDQRHENEVVWPEGRVNWRDGGVSPSNPSLTSFDLLDELQRVLANKKVFPNLTTIVIAGHSAGGQTVTRYEMSNKVDGKLNGVKTDYVVADPSTYAWPTAIRPLPIFGADPVGAYKEPVEYGTKADTHFEYGPFNSANAPGYNRWPFGLQDLSGYTKGMLADQLRKNLVERPTTYLLGEVDVLPLSGFDSRPDAMAQGPTRRARGEAFVKYVNRALGAHEKVIIVLDCAHNDRCIYTSADVLPVIFPGYQVTADSK